jgi:TRAP-type mannitol/chloroaromatic compound transport system substrate-binding protein
MTNRRDFIRRAGLAGAGAVGASTLAAPYVRAQDTITWRMQTYAGATLADHVIRPAIEAFNVAANGEMKIDLFTSDEIVPQGELFRAVQNGTLDAAQSDDDSMGSPVDVAIFGAYFPFASRYSLDVPALFHNYGLKEIWEEAYADTGVTWLDAGSWDPCNFATVEPIRSLADLQGKRVFTFPTGGRFMTQFGVVPVTLPWEDIEVAMQTGELDGIAWCGATELHTVGWANVTNYYLTDNINGAWIGSHFANTERWNALPEHLKVLFRLCIDSSNYYRQHWYWWGEAHYRTTGGKVELTSIPAEEWAQVTAAAEVFWDETAAESERNARVVQILKDYAATMEKAGPPYRYG